NKGLYEIMLASRVHKVVFDIDMYDTNTLAECKKVILQRFPGVQMNISGSIGETPRGTKYSYHIILQNYVVSGSELEYTNYLKAFCVHYRHLGFDPAVYKINGQIKFINQGKKDGRIQAYIEGSKDLLDHTVTHNVPSDAINIDTLIWSDL